jgi:exodeoxyribonuclease VII large subunit
MTASTLQDNRRVYQVSEINRLARVALENELGDVWIEGELSEVKKWPSGHIYFSLKDKDSVLRAVFFKRDQRGLAFELRDGDKVQAFGRLTIYEPQGKYQFVVRCMEPAGRGSLQEAFEKLKKKLAAEGLFEAARKKPLPMLPRRVGIVTSLSGAAIRDILNILSRRFPNLYILIAPVKVQGEGAAAEIAEAIDVLNARGGLDALIVGRGGGSLEDLWAFNEEVVARAIARSGLPVISAVGHEIDFTISDFVADLRAPTPSAAAELIVRPKADFEKVLQQLASRLARGLRQRALELKNRLLKVERSYVFREPYNLVRQSRQRIEVLQAGLGREVRHLLQRRQQRLDELSPRLQQCALVWRDARRQDLRRLTASMLARGLRQRALELKNRLLKVERSDVFREPRSLARQYRQRVEVLQAGLGREVRHLVQRRQQRLDELIPRLQQCTLVWRDARRQDLRRLTASLLALSPDAVLERGFSITRRADGRILRDAADVAARERLSTRLHRGVVESEVVKGGEHDGEERRAEDDV